MPLAKPKWELEHRQGNLEHDLYDGSIMEYNDIAGVDIDYYFFDPNSATLDRLYGEDPLANFIGPYRTKVVYEVTEENLQLDVFGVTSDDIIDLMQIPKSTFTRDVSGGVNPKPGDVVKIVWNTRAYEIVDVGEESSIFQLKKFVWEFICKPYRYSHQSASATTITTTQAVSAYGDNSWIESEADLIDTYNDVDESVYGF